MSVCLDVVLCFTVAAGKTVNIMPLLCCMTIVLVRNRGTRKHECVCVVTTFYSTVLHCTGIGSHRDLFRKKQMPEIKAQQIWGPFKILFFFSEMGRNMTKSMVFLVHAVMCG